MKRPKREPERKTRPEWLHDPNVTPAPIVWLTADEVGTFEPDGET